ncbi:MAG: CoA pyrophosphatase [Dehalococcoidia bacterium]
MKEKIRKILSQHEKKQVIDLNAVPSAVLIAIFEKNGEDHILFTKRTDTVEHHKGQISFPGGRRDIEDENLLQTALRESYEEVGIRPEDVEIVGDLDDEKTHVSNYVISPYVGFIPYPYPFKTSPEEVEQLLEIPISALIDKANFRQEIQTSGEKRYRAYFYYYGDDVIWGATSRILKRFFNLVCAGMKS